MAVLDLARLPALTGLHLPTAGWLTFFYDAAGQAAWGYDPATRDAWRVVHAIDAEPRSAPDATYTFPEVMLAPVEDLTSPDVSEGVFTDLRASHLDGLFAFSESLPPVDEPAYRIGGWPDLVQGSMWLEAQLASNGLYVGTPEDYQDTRVAELAPGAADWRLLLQIDSDDDTEMMWGDYGRLYYLIREEDLAAGAFDRCWFVLQCG